MTDGQEEDDDGCLVISASRGPCPQGKLSWSSSGTWQHGESLASGGVAKASVDADEGVSARPIVHPDECRAELHRVRGPQRMGRDEPQGTFPDWPECGNLGPRGAQLAKCDTSGGALETGQGSLAAPAFYRRRDLDGRDAPGHDPSAHQRAQGGGSLLGYAERYQCRTRPSSARSEAIFAIFDERLRH